MVIIQGNHQNPSLATIVHREDGQNKLVEIQHVQGVELENMAMFMAPQPNPADVRYVRQVELLHHLVLLNVRFVPVVDT
jgi:hypothetical protein